MILWTLSFSEEKWLEQIYILQPRWLEDDGAEMFLNFAEEFEKVFSLFHPQCSSFTGIKSAPEHNAATTMLHI